MSFRLSPRVGLASVCALLFFSGACALTYQVAWFRELRLIFGASTAASAAVLAVFMGGLGIGGAVLGKRADKAKNPLELYALLEIGVAILAALTPLFVRIAERVYLGLGGSEVLGATGATITRIVLSVLVLGPSTFLMGGTLPAAAKAVERESDVGRQRVAALYGVNTFGAVAGSLAANFLLLEVLGTQMTQWTAALVNLLVGVAARGMARSMRAAPAEPREEQPSNAPATNVAWFPPLAAGIAGGTFLLMELVWYRMLGPILGGSSYTFGLILAVALVGIATGGLLYVKLRATPTFHLFALTCGLEALFIGLPYALGDRIALLALFLRPLAKTGFAASVGVWAIVAAIVILPAAVVSGFQFPVVIGLYGHGANRVGRDVGHAYFANTLGSIAGSIAGGFGLLPVLSAPGCWRLVVLVLAATAGVALVVDARVRAPDRAAKGVIARGAPVLGGVLSLLTLLPAGPSAVWRHLGIGAGRADRYLSIEIPPVEAIERDAKGAIAWEEDGRESSVALSRLTGYTFIVNGKADGHVTVDAPTQVMSGLLGALLHENAKRTLVIGLGTGSTAGWLAKIPTMEDVRVIELEPAILRVAKGCAPVNEDVLANPKVKVTIGDAREALLTTKDRFDIIFSEPSNPYRAGIASLYTAEYYRAAAARLREGGIFIQWVQAYEIDGWAIATVATTLRDVFGVVTTWQTMSGDVLFFAQNHPAIVDIDRMRARLGEEPYRSAVRNVWHTTTPEGVLARFVGGPALTQFLVEKSAGIVNHDDQNVLEFAFARSVGRRARVDRDLVEASRRLGADSPQIKGTIDPTGALVERWLFQTFEHLPLHPPVAQTSPLAPLAAVFESLGAGRYASGLKGWQKLARSPSAYFEGELLARAAAKTNDPQFESFAALVTDEPQRDLLRGLFLSHGGARTLEPTVDALERGFLGMRHDPWTPPEVLKDALAVALTVGRQDVNGVSRLYRATAEPFAVEVVRRERLETQLRLARLIDVPECIHALDRFAAIPWSRSVMEIRLLCTRAANHPAQVEAEADLTKLLSSEVSFHVETPPPPPPPPMPPPRLDEDPAPDGG